MNIGEEIIEIEFEPIEPDVDAPVEAPVSVPAPQEEPVGV